MTWVLIMRLKTPLLSLSGPSSCKSGSAIRLQGLSSHAAILSTRKMREELFPLPFPTPQNPEC